MKYVLPKPALPVDQCLPELSEALARNRRAVLQAAPGAGKTTRVPPALQNASWLAGRRILVLEPRRLAARLAAEFMAEQIGETPGNTIGYRVRNLSKVGPRTRIEVLTEGILTRRIQRDPELSDVGFIIFDEFHERSLAADLGLALALDVQDSLRPDLRILVMSATLDSEALATMLDDAPVISSGGRQYPVETHYLTPRADLPLPRAAARQARKAVAECDGDVLVFLPGVAEIRAAAAALERSGDEIAVTPLYGALPLAAQQQAIRPRTDGGRKIVLATAIAETSLTIEGIRAVVDAGQMRAPRFDPVRGLTRLVTLPVSAAAAEQRRGRAGRLGPGQCFRLWSESRHRTLSAHSPAEIETADLTGFALELALWGERDPTALRLLTPPPAASFAMAVKLLQELGAIDSKGVITAHGRELATLGMHPRLGEMLLAARAAGTSGLAATLAALLEEGDPLHGAHADADLYRRLHAISGSGDAAVKSPARHRIRQQARRLQKRFGKGPDASSASADQLAALVAAAYPERVAQRRGDSHRYLLAAGGGAQLHTEDGLRQHRFLAVAHLRGADADARIVLATPLSETQLRTQFATRLSTTRSVRFDQSVGAVLATEQECLGALVLSEKRWMDAPAERVSAALLQGLADAGIDTLGWTPAIETWRARVMFLRAVQPELGLADLSDTALTADLADWLMPYLGGMSRLSHLQRLDLRGALKARLGWANRTLLDTQAPDHLTLPTGRRARIDYAVDLEGGQTPVLAAKLQDFFGWTSTPSIAGGRVPLTLHLLSPAGRPLQITRDLASFWQTAYPEVRKQMRGRYPKHPWPARPPGAD